MTRMSAVMLAVLCVVPVAAEQPPPLRILEGSSTAVTIGNDAFSVKVDSTGRLSNLQAGGIEYVSFVAMYSSPTSFETGKGVRAVQGETGEARGIGPIPEKIAAEQRGERYVVNIKRTAERQEICGGAPLYDLHQTVEVAPNGTVNLRYEFAWRRFFDPGSPTIYVALAGPTFTGLSYWADHSDNCIKGEFTEGANYTKYEGLSGSMRSMRAETPAGPFNLRIDTSNGIVSTRWGEQYCAIGLQVLRGLVYPGISSKVEFTIRVPVKDAGQGED